MFLEDTASSRDDSSDLWTTSPEYQRSNLSVSLSQFEEVTNLLLECPNLNSTHLFRADILFDSLRKLKTISEHELQHGIISQVSRRPTGEELGLKHAPPKFNGLVLERTVVRRLIPRNPRLDRSLEQSCFIFSSNDAVSRHSQKQAIVYVPHVQVGHDIPWYHPRVSALAYLFEPGETGATISVHVKALDSLDEEASRRLHRMLLSLLQTMVRLTKLEKSPEKHKNIASNSVSSFSMAPSALKDTILPQHIVQDTYTRLKQTYANDLIARWVEKTEPSKHVYEDLSIAAFLIELWKQMYKSEPFPGFVDLACGNGVLVYILIQEGYHGRGIDARSRKTWKVLEIGEHLEQKLCIPQPFLDATLARDEFWVKSIHNGLFPSGTFIISNHADELTPWTPILAALSDPENPLPFLAIPCCSHSLSGARFRYSIKDVDSTPNPTSSNGLPGDTAEDRIQDARGDLRALRTQRLQTANHSDEKSQYSCLTKKVVGLAREIGHEVEMTLIRIPSTRNIGIVGNRKTTAIRKPTGHFEDKESRQNTKSERLEQISKLLARECRRDGSINAASDIWIQRAEKLQESKGRGKVNLKGKLTTRDERASSKGSSLQIDAFSSVAPDSQ